MRHLPRSLALLLAFGFVACSKRPIGDREDAGGAMGRRRRGSRRLQRRRDGGQRRRRDRGQHRRRRDRRE